MKIWQTGDVIHATDVNRWEESVAVFTATVDGENITINDIEYDELKAMVTAGRLPRVIYTLGDTEGQVTHIEMLDQIEVEADGTGTPTGEYLVSSQMSLQFEKQADGSAMATL